MSWSARPFACLIAGTIGAAAAVPGAAEPASGRYVSYLHGKIVAWVRPTVAWAKR